LEDATEVDFKDSGDSKQRVECWIPQLAFNEADHGLRETGMSRQDRHRETTALARFPEAAHDLRADGLALLCFGHPSLIGEK
jgi:hypothetical protein